MDGFLVLPEACRRLLATVNSVVAEQSMPRLSHEILFEDQVLTDLELTIRNKFPTVKLHPFGSRLTTLSNKSSDLDIFVDCGDAYNCTRPNRYITAEYVNGVEKCLLDENHIWLIVNVVRTCRVPIIRAYHKPSGMECDLAFSNGLAVEDSKLLRLYADNYPICRQLILCMRQWIKSCDFHNLSGINSYVISWLVIYYLQQRKIVPSVAEVIERGGSARIGDWENATTIKMEPLSGAHNFINILRGLLMFYVDVDYEREVICPLLGATVEKSTFKNNLSGLPSVMRRYNEYIGSCRKPTFFLCDTPMCIQDPVELSRNLTVPVLYFPRKSFIHGFSMFTD